MKNVWIFLILATVILSSCGLKESPEIGAFAPDFDAATLHADVLRLSEFRGKPVMLNFWATWCPPCRLEMPAIQDRSARYENELVILAINYDEPNDLVAAFETEFGLTMNIVMDPGGKFQDLYQVRGYPTSVFIDSEGVIQNIHVGLMTEPTLDNYLSQLGVGE